MKRDTIDFLETLLWVADDPDEERRPLIGKSVYDFSNAFVAGAEAFIDGFRQHRWRPASAHSAAMSICR